MDALKAITARRSVRRFLSDKVPRNDLETLVEAGRMAPTANNSQPWEFVIVQSPEKRQAIAELTDYGGFLENAPVIMVVTCRQTDYSLEDGCAAVENILIAATARGLGSCWVAGARKPYADKVLSLVKAPGNQTLIALVGIGYAAEDMELRPSKRMKMDVTHWETF